MGTLDAVERYFAGWKERDAEAILGSLAECGTYEDPLTGGPIGGDALRGYVGALWSAFPDLTFEITSLAETGPSSAAAEWVMIGVNSGSMNGLPPTGKPVRQKGADFFTLDGGKVKTVTGYFDSVGVPRQIGLDVIVQPVEIGPFRFGTAVSVQSGRSAEPGAFSITSLEASDDKAVEAVREGSRASLVDMLQTEGFIGAVTARFGRRMVTVSAWDDPDAPRRTMREGQHAKVMASIPDGTLADAAYTSVYAKHRINPVHIRCQTCGKMSRGAKPGDSCACGSPLPDFPPFW